MFVYTQRNTGMLVEKIRTVVTGTGKVGGKGDVYELGIRGRREISVFYLCVKIHE